MIRKIGMAAGILLSALFSHAASAAYQLNLTTGATKLSQEVYDLHNLMMWIILVIFVGVFGVMFSSVYAHRKSVGHAAKELPEPIWVEIGWTVVPLLIVIPALAGDSEGLASELGIALGKAAVVLGLLLFLGPVAAGLLGTLLPAFGWWPDLGGTRLGLDAWRALASVPGSAAVAVAVAVLVMVDSSELNRMNCHRLRS